LRGGGFLGWLSLIKEFARPGRVVRYRARSLLFGKVGGKNNVGSSGVRYRGVRRGEASDTDRQTPRLNSAYMYILSVSMG
jgi:hypothetical protein